MKQRGFTVVELMVTMAIGAVLVTAVVAMYLTVLGQSPMVKTRNTLSTNLQNALNRINDDVRRSSNVTVYNLTPDPNAPMSKVGYENVPGPLVDTDDKYFWRMGEHRLLLNQTPTASDGNPIYDNAEYAAGKKNTIVYYVRDGALYRRVIAAEYPTNAVTTTTCARVTQGGCIDSDIKLIDNLKASLGAEAFKVTYYDRNGNQILNTSKDSGGNDVPDYTAFPLTRSIGVKIQLESGVILGNQTVSVTNDMRMQFRSQLNVVPPKVVNPYVPPTNGIGTPGLMAGPGGLSVRQGTVQGGDTYVKGKVNLDFGGFVGGGFLFPLFGGTATNLNVSNIACGSGANYPQPCGSSSQPITITGSSSIRGTVCARDQVTKTSIFLLAPGRGFIDGCEPPEVDLPTFDKAAFTASMTNGSAPGSAASCNSGSTTLVANRKYTSNVNVQFWCDAWITGSTYITGNLTSSGYPSFRVAESVGKVRPIIVVNGKISLSGTSIVPNSYGTTPYFISFFSSDNNCSISDSCNSLTPEKLKQTLDDFAGHSSPIVLSSGNGRGASFYSYFGEIFITFNASPGAVGGQRIHIDGAGVAMDAQL